MAGGLDPQARAREELEASARLAASLAEGDLPALAVKAADILTEALRADGTILLCGNGGSAADAQHLAAELVGRLDAGGDRRPLAAVALTTDTSVLTAVGNDFGFEEVFARQVAALARPGDVLVCLSTSGRSANVLRAARAARERDIRVVALVGPEPSALDQVADVILHAPGDTSGRIQQAHITLGHLLCELVDEAFRTP